MRFQRIVALLAIILFFNLTDHALHAQGDTVPMIKLVPMAPAAPTIVPDSLLYHFPWAEGIAPPAKAELQPKRVSPVYFVNDSIVSQLSVQAIDPATIATVDVLKGAAAEARHAGTAKSGVVLIYLKKPE